MSGRSSRRSFALLAAVVGLGACGKSAPPPPEADPAKVTDVAKKIAANMPGMSSLPPCKPDDLQNVVPLTYHSVLVLSGDTSSKEPRDADWINPPELDGAAVRTLVDSQDAKAKRRAAAQVLHANAYLLYKVDVVNAPMALGFKELKIGTILTRYIRFGHDLMPTCVSMLDFQNDQAKSDWAISVSDKAVIDPAVAKALRDDLAAQYVKNAPRPTTVPAKATPKS
jgi:hypothetical protein